MFSIQLKSNRTVPLFAERISKAVHFLCMNRQSAFCTHSGLLGAFFLIALTGLLPAGALYWLMRPTVVVNPGLNAYQPPRPDPLFARNSHSPNYASLQDVAKQQRTDGRSAFAEART